MCCVQVTSPVEWLHSTASRLEPHKRYSNEQNLRAICTNPSHRPWSPVLRMHTPAPKPGGGTIAAGNRDRCQNSSQINTKTGTDKDQDHNKHLCSSIGKIMQIHYTVVKNKVSQSAYPNCKINKNIKPISLLQKRCNQHETFSRTLFKVKPVIMNKPWTNQWRKYEKMEIRRNPRSSNSS